MQFAYADGVSELKPLRCQHCGAPAASGARACGYCGVAFDAKSASTTSSAAVTPTNPADAEIEASIRSGNLIDAIRVYRASRKCSLGEAKAACEAWAQRLVGRP